MKNVFLEKNFILIRYDIGKGVSKGTIRIHCNELNYTLFELFLSKPIAEHIDWHRQASLDFDKQRKWKYRLLSQGLKDGIRHKR